MNEVAKLNESEGTHVVSDDGATVMSLISKAVSDPAFDVVKLEKLMDLQERILNRNAKAEFAADFVKMQPRLPKVIRRKKNDQTNSMYAPLEDINMAVGPVLAEFGFGISSKVIRQDDAGVTVRAELWHRGGHIETNELTMPHDDTGIKGTVNKTKPHALASAIMYARRGAEAALLNISTGEDRDGNKPTPASEPITMEQAADLDTRARAVSEIFLKNFLAHFKVGMAMEIKQKDYQRAANAIKEAETKKATQGQKVAGENA
jgi:hypothetical protein